MRLLQTTFLVAVLLATGSKTVAAPVQQTQLAGQIGKVVAKYFPNAVVAQDNGTFTAKHGTMVFTIHRHLKTGEILKETF